MNLVVDIGNTVLKAAVTDGVTLGKTYRYQGEKGMEYIEDLLLRHHPEKMAICSARTLTGRETERLTSHCPTTVMDPDRNAVARQATIPEHVTPAAVASIIAARHMFHGQGCSIFDFGTMLTTAFLSGEGQYLGGNISPGCTTRFRSISRYAKNLPLLSESDDVQKVGNSITSSIRGGVVSGIMFEIEGYMALYPDNVAVFTGGDANYFAKRTKNSIFVVSNLVLMGLALIADGDE